MSSKEKKQNSKKNRIRFYIQNLAAIVGLTSVLSFGGFYIRSLNKGADSQGPVIEYEYEDGHIHKHKELEDIITPSVEETEETLEVDETEEVLEVEEEITDNIEISNEEKSSYDFGSVVIRNYDGISIVEALHLNGYESSFAFRKQLAEYHGITNYTGTAEQNILLLNILRDKALTQDSNENEEKLPSVNPDSATTNNSNDNHNHKPSGGNNNNPGSEEEKHTHKFTRWQSFSDTQEIGFCSCGEKDYRGHSYGGWIDNGNGTETRTCKTCGHKMSQNIAHEHSWSDWEYIGNGVEERSCSCGHTETRTHTHEAAPSDLVYGNPQSNNDGTHSVSAGYICSVCKETVNVTKDMDCTYGEWIINDKTHQQKCTECNYAVTNNHKPDSNGISTSMSADAGVHDKSYVCEDCNHNVTYQEPCISDNSQHTDTINGVVVDHSLCTECGDVCDIREHKHNYGSATYVDDQYESVTCSSCLETTNQTHTWEYNAGNTEKTCTSCGHKDQVCAHDYTYNSRLEYQYTADVCYIEVGICKCGDETTLGSYGHPQTEVIDNSYGVITKQCLKCFHQFEEQITQSNNEVVPEEPIAEETPVEEAIIVEESTIEVPVEETPVEETITEVPVAEETTAEEPVTEEPVQTFELTEEQYNEIVNEVLEEKGAQDQENTLDSPKTLELTLNT